MTKSIEQLILENEAHLIFQDLCYIREGYERGSRPICFDVPRIISFLKDERVSDIILDRKKDSYKNKIMKTILQHYEIPELMTFIVKEYPLVLSDDPLYEFESYLNWGLRTNAKILFDNYPIDIDDGNGRIWKEVSGRSEHYTVAYLTKFPFKHIYDYNLLELYYKKAISPGCRGRYPYARNLKTIYEAYYKNNKVEWAKVPKELKKNVLIMVKDSLNLSLLALGEDDE